MTTGRFTRLFAAALTSSVALAARAQSSPPASTPVAKPPARAAGKPRVPRPETETKPAPDAKVTIETPATRGPWTLRVFNGGDVPFRLVADARLLALDVVPRSARASTHCELPADMRPSDDLDRTLVVPPGRSYAESFEPRLYCFGSKLDALAPGAIVIAHLGWTTGRKTEAPFVVSAIEGVEPELAPLKSIDSRPVALPDEPSAWMVPAVRAEHDVESDAARLSIGGPTTIDATSPNDIAIPLTLRNEGARSIVVRFRPEVIGFDVIAPAGVEHCAWPMVPAAAMRELFTTVPPKGAETLSVALGSYCTKHALDQEGLIVARPRLDTRNASGAAVGLRSFDGEVIALTPTVVRLHRGAKPLPLVRPRLEPTP
jgi:hypothetical protein